MDSVDLLLSGGLDSAILAAELKEKYKVKAYSFNQANSLLFATKVSSILDIDLNIINIQVNNDRNEVNRAIIELAKGRSTDLYLGITALPPFHHDDQPPRPSQQEIEAYTYLKAPYANLTKDKVLQKGFKFSEFDQLIKYTHSCYTTKNKRCNECFNCKERKWAFKTIGLIDYGKY
jgi:7-cyano-7-deazaguanine synthase in queuosine biosynthesis